jgi:D-alanyl-D-alanine dipeptidase
MLRLKGRLVLTILAILLAVVLPVNAAPPDIPPGIKQLIGLYEAEGTRFLLRENDGRVEMVYDLGGEDGPAFSVYAVYPLQTVADNEYQLNIVSPLEQASGRISIGRDAAGYGTACLIGQNTYSRRFFGPELGQTYRIEALHSVNELRQMAAAASPPRLQGEFVTPDLVNVAALDPTIRLDIRYATTNNFMGAAFYDRPRAFLQRPAAEALVRVHKKLTLHGYGILIHDAYRPWTVTKMFWDATPAAQKIFVADPEKGSRHNRGGAVDVSLYELATGQPAEMISGYDEFSLRAHAEYPGGTAHQRRLREILGIYMLSEGFSVYEEEWWHYDYRDWQIYPLMNISFAELDAAANK